MELVDRVRERLGGAVEKRMFGGTGFMIDGALVCSVDACVLTDHALDRGVRPGSAAACRQQLLSGFSQARQPLR